MLCRFPDRLESVGELLRRENAGVDNGLAKSEKGIAVLPCLDFLLAHVRVLAIRRGVAEAARDVVQNKKLRTAGLSRRVHGVVRSDPSVDHVASARREGVEAARVVDEAVDEVVSAERDADVVVRDAEDDGALDLAVERVVGEVHRGEEVGVVEAAVAERDEGDGVARKRRGVEIAEEILVAEFLLALDDLDAAEGLVGCLSCFLESSDGLVEVGELSFVRVVAVAVVVQEMRNERDRHCASERWAALRGERRSDEEIVFVSAEAAVVAAADGVGRSDRVASSAIEQNGLKDLIVGAGRRDGRSVGEAADDRRRKVAVVERRRVRRAKHKTDRREELFTARADRVEALSEGAGDTRLDVERERGEGTVDDVRNIFLLFGVGRAE